MSSTTASSDTASSSPARRIPRPQELASSQKLMVFVLSMVLFGLANILTEVLPEFRVGPVELSVSYLAFVPVVMVSLFHPLYAALGAPLGEIIFVDLLMGNFSGVGELEGYIQLALGLYIGGSLVRDPARRGQVALAAIVAVLIDKGVGGAVDILKVVVGVEDLESVQGLPESILALEGVAFASDLLISGIIFGAIPAAYLAPRLHGKIEPLMGMAPRDPRVPLPGRARQTAGFIGLAVVLFIASGLFAFLEYVDVELGLWEPDFLEQYGMGFLWVSVAACAVVLVTVVLLARRSARRRRLEAGRATAASATEVARSNAGV
ncbi:cell division protein FtsQ [Actinotalea sp. BY-33]|uniref:Cell division protein FtsQ n=1 Tax=Actinotalea soli TaxID=2819234 RepID=A0A939LRM8_9CELL|nr:cell division protein FtsQ [Actinotalea soli]MBO1752788.1 cell division protein FtsQ [Actinotalea soli]